MLVVTTSNPSNVKVISIGAGLKIPSLLIAPPRTVATDVAVPFSSLEPLFVSQVTSELDKTPSSVTSLTV